ncbi:hypothetical protein CBR_g52308, partial [Chara braunii]
MAMTEEWPKVEDFVSKFEPRFVLRIPSNAGIAASGETAQAGIQNVIDAKQKSAAAAEAAAAAQRAADAAATAAQDAEKARAMAVEAAKQLLRTKMAEIEASTMLKKPGSKEDDQAARDLLALQASQEAAKQLLELTAASENCEVASAQASIAASEAELAWTACADAGMGAQAAEESKLQALQAAELATSSLRNAILHKEKAERALAATRAVIARANEIAESKTILLSILRPESTGKGKASANVQAITEEKRSSLLHDLEKVGEPVVAERKTEPLTVASVQVQKIPLKTEAAGPMHQKCKDMEDNYVRCAKENFRHLREERAVSTKYFVEGRIDFYNFLKRQDGKQAILDTFQARSTLTNNSQLTELSKGVKAHEAIFCTLPALTDEEVEEKTVPLLRALVDVRTVEDHAGQLAKVFDELKKLREDMALMAQQHRDQLQQLANVQPAQSTFPSTYPASSAACQSVFAPLNVSFSTSSSSLSVANSQSGSAAGPDPAATAAAAASGGAGNSGTVVAPGPDPAMAGPGGSFAYIDRKAAQIPSKYDEKDDLESWISSMRSYFDVLRTPPSTQSSILGTNVEPVVRGFLETQAVQSGYKRTNLNKWLKATPTAALEDLLIKQYVDPHAAAKARLKLDKLKHSKWTGTMHSLQQYVSKLFATPDLEMTAQSCLDVIKGTVPFTLKDRLGLGLSRYTDWLTLMRDLIKLEAQDLPGGSSGKKATSRKRFPGSNCFAAHDLLEADEETLVDESSLDDDQEQDYGASCSLSAHESENVNDEESMNAFKKTAFK